MDSRIVQSNIDFDCVWGKFIKEPDSGKIKVTYGPGYLETELILSLIQVGNVLATSSVATIII